MRLILLFLFVTFRLGAESLQLSIAAESAILMNARSGAILYEKRAHEPSFPASTTKIATALLSLKLCHDKLGQLVTADRDAVATISPQAKKQSNYRSPPHWLETDGTHIGIKAGEEFRLYDLLNAVLVASANDASNVIARHIGGTVPKFMEQLNCYLKEIGCQNTQFNNPHGLHHPEHVTTAYDLALMAKEGLKDPIFRKIVSTVRYTSAQTNLEYERNFVQTNLLLRNSSHNYPKAIGVKTGTTQAAGKNLVAAAQDGDRILIAVALGHRGDRSGLYQDITKMFETAFNEPKMRRHLLPKGPQTISSKVPGGRGRLTTELPDGLYYDYFPSEEAPIKAIVKWDFSSLPIQKGECVGEIQVIDAQGHVLQQMPLLAFKDMKPTLWRQTKQLLSFKSTKSKAVIFGGAACIFLFILRVRKKKQNQRPLYR